MKGIITFLCPHLSLPSPPDRKVPPQWRAVMKFHVLPNNPPLPPLPFLAIIISESAGHKGPPNSIACCWEVKKARPFFAWRVIGSLSLPLIINHLTPSGKRQIWLERSCNLSSYKATLSDPGKQLSLAFCILFLLMHLFGIKLLCGEILSEKHYKETFTQGCLGLLFTTHTKKKKKQGSLRDRGRIADIW